MCRPDVTERRRLKMNKLPEITIPHYIDAEELAYELSQLGKQAVKLFAEALAEEFHVSNREGAYVFAVAFARKRAALDKAAPAESKTDEASG